MKRPKIGDLIEIRTKRGLAYAQFTHKHPTHGALLRILEGFYSDTPTDLVALANTRSTFQTFFPLAATIKRGTVSIVGNAPIPEDARAFPIFRNGVADPLTKVVKDWWLWDGQKEWMVGDLTPEQWKYPLEAVWNDTLLIERIEEDWKQEESSW